MSAEHGEDARRKGAAAPGDGGGVRELTGKCGGMRIGARVSGGQ